MLKQRDQKYTSSALQSRKRFSEHLRLTIYSYIDTETIITHLSLLSKKDRQNIFNSYIIREGKSHRLDLYDDDFDVDFQAPRISLVENLKIYIDDPQREWCQSLLDQIKDLPQRFHNRKIDLIYYNMKELPPFDQFFFDLGN